MKNSKKVFVIPDLHFPFHHKKAYKRMIEHIRLEQPDVVIQIGDLLDQYVFSKYSKSASVTPEEDVLKGIQLAKKMWRDIKKMVPRAQMVQVLGNHDVRLSKRISEKIPELQGFVDIKKIYSIPNYVKVLDSYRDYLELDGVIYTHGWLSKSIDHSKYFNKSCVHGHRHRCEIVFDNAKLWSMDVGYLADKDSLPLSYTQSKFSKWTLACGLVENGYPRLIILEDN